MQIYDPKANNRPAAKDDVRKTIITSEGSTTVESKINPMATDENGFLITARYPTSSSH